MLRLRIIAFLSLFISNNVFGKLQINNPGFSVVNAGAKYYFLLADSLLNRDFLIVARLEKSSITLSRSAYKIEDPTGGYGGYAGEKINDHMIRFEHINNYIVLREQFCKEKSSDNINDGQNIAFSNSNLQPFEKIFPIESFTETAGILRIDITSMITGDNSILYLSEDIKTQLGLVNFQPENSFISSVHSYNLNTIIRSTRTYIRQGGNSSTIELATNIYLLSKMPMKTRYADNRVGYFTKSYSDFNGNNQAVSDQNIITRWKLEVKPEDSLKYQRGELVEPIKPVIFYIDPATPKKWILYLMMGVTDWQCAFESAGFKNAIQARVAPTKQEDSAWSFDDIRYSTIVYIASDKMDAGFSTVTDPRSGEILQVNIRWNHNVMKLLHNRYFIQASPNVSEARKMLYSDSLMGELIRNTCSHEIGHALGFPHNWGASATVTVTNLRNKTWLDSNGICPSIMDYARFNYVAQPSDGIDSKKGLFSRIGDYDKWAIYWGYKIISGDQDEKSIADTLNRWILEKQSDPRLWYGGEREPDLKEHSDPRIQVEDLGNDAMEASRFGILNLMYVSSHLIEWTRDSSDNWINLKEMYHQLVDQFSLYIGHVVNNIGGRYELPKNGTNGVMFKQVSKIIQKRAVKFMYEQLWVTPFWLMDTAIANRTGEDLVSLVGKLQGGTLNGLLDPAIISKLKSYEPYKNDSSYSTAEYISDIHLFIWSNLTNHKPIDFFSRNLQVNYVNSLIKLINHQSYDPVISNISNCSLVELDELRRNIIMNLSFYQDLYSLTHLNQILITINSATR